MRAVLLIARTVLIEAVRRREIYVVVLLSLLLIGTVMMVDFFDLEGLTKFYREVALQVMSMAAAITTIVLACRQLPREFENRTIHPLLAKPVGRATFLAGKLAGVMGAAAFCFTLFMAVYLAGSWWLGTGVPWGLFAQYFYLQMLMMLILATLGFALSLRLNLDAALTIGVVFYFTSAVIMSASVYIYSETGTAGRLVLLVLNYALPQLALFDLSEKAVHSEAWGPLPALTMANLTVYGAAFAALYFALAYIQFRRRPL